MPETAATTVTARLMERWECLPSEFREPLTESLSLDTNWVWVAETESKVIGFLAACPCHGVSLIVRLRVGEQAPFITLLVLLRQFFRDSCSRGMKGFIAFLDSSSPIEVRLGEIMKNSFKGQPVSPSFFLVAAEFPRRG